MKIRYSDIGVFLEPGRMFVSDRPVLVKTILGSCVAVCLYDPRRRVGGVNHYLLAYPGKNDVGDGGRYGSTSLQMLIDRIQDAGAQLPQLRAVVVGGGRPVGSDRGPQVGEGNRQVALDVLRRFGIPILREETGGEFGRRLFFNTGTGEVIVSIIAPSYVQAAGTFDRRRP